MKDTFLRLVAVIGILPTYAIAEVIQCESLDRIRRVNGEKSHDQSKVVYRIDLESKTRLWWNADSNEWQAIDSQKLKHLGNHIYTTPDFVGGMTIISFNYNLSSMIEVEHTFHPWMDGSIYASDESATFFLCR